MSPIYFASSNKEKVANAQHACQLAKIPFQQVTLEIDEIQGEDPLIIVEAKARAAYQAFGKPVVVSDDSWSIYSLNGFPGAYMKSMNYWFTPDDFLRLMHGVENRAIALHQYLAYCDGMEVVTFSKDIPGTMLQSSFGDETKAPWMNVVTLDGDKGKSLAEIFNGPEESILKRYQNRPDVWHDLLTWYKEKYA